MKKSIAILRVQAGRCREPGFGGYSRRLAHPKDKPEASLDIMGGGVIVVETIAESCY